MITISTKHVMLSSVAFAALVGATPAMAQDASANATADTAADNSAIIIVTAQKREQNAQDVPISLVAVTGASIESQGISSLQELGNSIAGVTILAANPGAMRLAIRGASDLSSSNQSASVNGFYLDETAMS